ncbi:MAG: hypothetical protein GEU79_06415 [Acidimicrobiia bacterium]|nr:hypothetical protein [Acidimicrobiia bacterium]
MTNKLLVDASALSERASTFRSLADRLGRSVNIDGSGCGPSVSGAISDLAGCVRRVLAQGAVSLDACAEGLDQVVSTSAETDDTVAGNMPIPV